MQRGINPSGQPCQHGFSRATNVYYHKNFTFGTLTIHSNRPFRAVYGPSAPDLVFGGPVRQVDAPSLPSPAPAPGPSLQGLVAGSTNPGIAALSARGASSEQLAEYGALIAGYGFAGGEGGLHGFEAAGARAAKSWSQREYSRAILRAFWANNRLAEVENMPLELGASGRYALTNGSKAVARYAPGVGFVVDYLIGTKVEHRGKTDAALRSGFTLAGGAALGVAVGGLCEAGTLGIGTPGCVAGGIAAGAAGAYLGGFFYDELARPVASSIGVVDGH